MNTPISNSKLTAEQQKAISQAKNINNSDFDLCEFGGKTIIFYSWGNQQGKEFLADGGGSEFHHLVYGSRLSFSIPILQFHTSLRLALRSGARKSW